MEQIEKEVKKLWIRSIFMSLLLSIIGIFLFMNPSFVIQFISFVLGIFMVVAGIFSLVKYFHTKEKNFYGADLLYGVISCLAGALLIFNPTAVASILPLVLGVWMVINSVVKLQYAFSLKSHSHVPWVFPMIMALITLSLGILFVINPFRGATFLMQFLGAMITLYAVIDFINAFSLQRNMKEIKKTKKQIKEILEDA